jgi:hypothetical protein
VITKMIRPSPGAGPSAGSRGPLDMGAPWAGDIGASAVEGGSWRLSQNAACRAAICATMGADGQWQQEARRYRSIPALRADAQGTPVPARWPCQSLPARRPRVHQLPRLSAGQEQSKRSPDMLCRGIGAQFPSAVRDLRQGAPLPSPNLYPRPCRTAARADMPVARVWNNALTVHVRGPARPVVGPSNRDGGHAAAAKQIRSPG